MNELLFNTIKTVFALAAMQGKKLCFSPSDGQFYEVKDRTADGCTLYAVGGVGCGTDTAPIFHLAPGELIFADDILAQSQKNAFQTLTNAFETLTKRDGNADETQFSTLSQRDGNAMETQPTAPTTIDQRPLIGRGKVDLPRFSHLYAGDVADKCAKIENLLDKILTQTNYPKTIQKTIANYHTASQLAKDGKVYELSILADRLQGRINKQAAMSAAMDTVAARQTARRRMTFAIVLLVFIVGGYFGLQYFTPFTSDTTPSAESATVAAVPQSVFDTAIEEWQRTHDRKIYPAGRECLRKACVGVNDKAAIMLIIDKNMK